MADVFKGLTIKLGADTKDLSKALKEVGAQARDTSRELKQIEKAMKINPSSKALGARQIELLSQQAETANERLNRLRVAEEQLDKTKLSSEQWSKLQAEIAIAEANVKKYQDALNQAVIKQNAASSLLGKMGQKLQSWGKTATSIGTTMQSVGGTLSRTLTPAIVAAGAASIAAAVDIDTSLTNVRKTVDGTEQQYQALKQAAIDFSKTNAVSATEILDIQSLGAQLGFAIDELDEFSRVVSGLDIATNMNAEQAATELAQFANITKMSHSDISRYGSAIVGLGNSFATTESDISSMAMRIAAAGTQVGMSQADILGLATALSSLGVEAEAGGTAISTVMANIDKAVATNSESLSTWAQTANMSVDEFSAAWKNNAAEALGAVLSGMEKAVAEGGNMSVMLDELGISSIRQTDILKRMAGNSQLVTDAVAKSNEEWSKNTALQAEVDNRNASLAAKFEMLKNRLVAIAESVGGPLADALLDVVDAAEPLFQAIEDGAKAFSNMSKEEQQVVLACAGLAAALGPVMSVTGSLLTKIGPLGEGLSKLAEFFARVGGAGGAVASSIGNVGAATSQAGQSAVTASKGFSGLSAVLRGNLIVATLIALFTALGIAVMGAVDGFKKAAANTENLSKATTGLHDSITKVPGSYDSASSSVGEFGNATSETAKSVTELAESQAKLSDSIAERNDVANDDIQALTKYQDVIDRFAGKTDLNAKQVAQLQQAIEGVNKVTGSSWSLAQDEAGAYQVIADGAVKAADEIKNLINTMKMQREVEAVSQNLADAQEQQTEAVKTQAKAHEEYNKALKEQKDVEGQNIEIQQRAADKVRETGLAYQNATKMRLEADAAVKASTDSLAILTIAQQENATAAERMVAESAAMRSTLLEGGQSAVEFADALEITGANIQDIKDLGPEAMVKLADAYDGSIDSIIGKLKELGVSFDETQMESFKSMDAMLQDADLFNTSVQQAFTDAGVSTTDFIGALANAGVSVSDFRALSADQLAQVVDLYGTSKEQALAKMNEFVEANRTKGAEAGQAWYSGFSENTMAAAQAAADMAGQSVDEFLAAVPDFAQASEQDLMAYIEGLKSGNGEGGQVASQNEIQGIENDNGEWNQAGVDKGQELDQGIPEGANGDGAQQAAQNELDATGNVDGQFADKSTQWGEELDQGIPNGATGEGANQAVSNELAAVAGREGEFNSIGVSYGNALSTGFASADMASTGTAVQRALDIIRSYTGEFSSAGNEQGQAYTDGVQSADGYGAGSELANAANDGAGSVDGYSTGAYFGQGFVNGVRAYVGAAAEAAAALVRAAKDAADKEAAIGSPSKEMYKRGMWFDQGMALGIEEYTPEVERASTQLVTKALASLDNVDAWVYGYHTATNYADGLYSGYDEIEEAAKSDSKKAEEEFKAYQEQMIANYKARSENYRGQVASISGYIWGGVTQAIKDLDYVTPDTGHVYAAMKVIEDAGYSLDSYKDKLDDMIEKKAEWDEKMSADKVSDSVKESAAKFEQEYNEWLAFVESVGASIEDLDTWNSMYKLKDNVISGINDAKEWNATLTGLFNETGIAYSKNFVDRVIKGGDEYKDALAQLVAGGTEGIQKMVDAYDDLARAEREQELNTRALWVNSLKTINDNSKNAKDLLLDFKESVLDVAEAVYSDRGLSAAFARGGTTFESFALSLEGLDVTMDDFSKNFDSFVGSVTNGFSQMTKYNQTSFEEWRDNLKLNMAESQAYAANLEKVMAAIPNSIDSEAFRKAIYEGGFQQWGKVIADMASMSSADIAGAVKLYNQAIIEAQSSALSQFKALSPGAEMIEATITGIESNQSKLNTSSKLSASNAAGYMATSYNEWYITGQYLADGAAAGVNSKFKEVADQAAEMVRQAIAAARAAAGIHSPSRVMRDEVGKMMGEGLGLGMKDETRYITQQAKRLIDIPLTVLKDTQSVANSVVNNSQMAVTNEWNITVRNDQDLRRLTLNINREMDRAYKAGGGR